MTTPRRATIAAFGAALLLLLALAIPAHALQQQLSIDGLLHRTWEVVRRDFPFALPPYLALVLILGLERRYPARPQSAFSPSLCLDLLWMLLAMPVAIFTMAGYLRVLDWIFQEPLRAYRFDLADHVPFAVVLAISLVLGDLLAWWYHYLKHRVPVLWRFHAIHHSTTEMNPFADARIHLAEYFINRTVIVLPFFLLGGDAREGMTALLLAMLWYARFYHSNVRTNLGPLRHVLVTPQYHRMHHSMEDADADRNFGNFLTIWDRLFGTMIRDYGRYPLTGVPGGTVPIPVSRHPSDLLTTYWAQCRYPFARAKARATGQYTPSPVEGAA